MSGLSTGTELTRRESGGDRLLFRILLTVSAILLVAWSFVIPVFEAPDEASHWEVSRYIHDHWALPPYTEQYAEAGQPPAYYLALAALAFPVTVPAAPPVRDSTGLPIGCCPSPFKLRPNRYSDFKHFWVLRFARLLTAAFAFAGIYFTYRACFVLTGSASASLLAGSFMAFLPEFSFKSTAIGNDGAVAALSALCLLLSSYLYRHGATWRKSLVSGAILGMSFLSKVSGICVAASLAISLVFSSPTKDKWKRFAGAFGVALLMVLPWLLRNKLLYGDILAAKAGDVALKVLVQKRALSDPYFRDVFPTAFWRSFVGVFGHMSIPLSKNLFLTYDVIFLLAFAGLAAGILRRKVTGVLLLLLISPVLLNVALAIVYNMNFPQPQGRFLFASLPCLAILVGIGLSNLVNYSRAGTVTAAILLLTLNLAAMSTAVLPAYWLPDAEGMSVDLQVNQGPQLVPAGPLTSSRTLRQQFFPEHDCLAKLEVLVAIYGRRPSQGDFRLTLSEESRHAVVASKIIAAHDLRDNSPVTFAFPPIEHSKANAYVLSIDTVNLGPGDQVTVWLADADTYRRGELQVGNAALPRDLYLKTYFHVPEER